MLKPEPLFEAVESLKREKTKVILLSPAGRKFNQAIARELAQAEDLLLITGHYEGFDERIVQGLKPLELSIGDYVLSGGELGAAVIVDTVTRLIPGAVGNAASTRQESFTAAAEVALDTAFAGEGPFGFCSGQVRAPLDSVPSSTCGSGGLLDYPHYTRPAEFRGMAVPEVLVNGNHEQIRRWRRKTALAKTLRNRPDLLEGAALGEEDRKLLAEVKGEGSEFRV